jgi:hypothetical protein
VKQMIVHAHDEVARILHVEGDGNHAMYS